MGCCCMMLHAVLFGRSDWCALRRRSATPLLLPASRVPKMNKTDDNDVVLLPGRQPFIRPAPPGPVCAPQQPSPCEPSTTCRCAFDRLMRHTQQSAMSPAKPQPQAESDAPTERKYVVERAWTPPAPCTLCRLPWPCQTARSQPLG